MFRGTVLRLFFPKTAIINAHSGLFCNELFMLPCFKNSNLSTESISELNWWSNSTIFDAIESPWCFFHQSLK